RSASYRTFDGQRRGSACAFPARSPTAARGETQQERGAGNGFIERLVPSQHRKVLCGDRRATPRGVACVAVRSRAGSSSIRVRQNNPPKEWYRGGFGMRIDIYEEQLTAKC